MIKILFVCHGNICRSTMSQYVFQDMVHKINLTDSFYIDSAATSREEIGNPVHHGTRHKLKEVGIPCGDHRARQMRREDYDAFDYIIGMDSWNIRNIGRIIGNSDPERERYSGSWISRSAKARILRIRGIQVILILHTGT